MHSNDIKKVYSWLQGLFTVVSRRTSEILRQLTSISRPFLGWGGVGTLIRWTIVIPFLFALTFSILPILVFVIPGLFVFYRWITILSADDFNIGDMKVPTFYSESTRQQEGAQVALIFLTSVVGVVFGGIHCAGWFFTFPSSDEAMLWRVSSAVLTGIAFLIPLFFLFYGIFSSENHDDQLEWAAIIIFSIILLVYVVSRLLLIVEAFISLRHLTPGMLALVKWTSFIPHI
jgi:hypothetical protein